MPPLVTDIDLSMDDKYLYVACWGTGDLQQYDVSDPFKPKLTGKVRIGGIVSKATHPGARNGALNGGPQMVEISRDGLGPVARWQSPVTVICTMARQFRRKKLPIALKIGFQKHPRKQYPEGSVKLTGELPT